MIRSVFLLSGMVVCLAASAEPSFRTVDVDTNVQIGYGIVLEDVDGDGMKDIILADKKQFVWYSNPTWERHVMIEGLTERDNVCIAARDLDGDGKVEVAVGAGWNPGNTINSGSVHYLIAPEDRRQKWETVALPYEPTTHRMRWVKTGDDSFVLVVVPLHGRGNRGGKGDGVRTLAYHRPANPKDPWRTTLVSDSLHISHNFDPIQWDEDSAEELLVAGLEGVYLYDLVDGVWTETKIASTQKGHSEFIGAGEVRMGSLGVGRSMVATVEPLHGNQAVVYTQAGGPSAWKRHLLDGTLRAGHGVACGDLLGLGRDQIVVGWRSPDEQKRVGIKLFTPKSTDGDAWDVSWIDNNGMATEDVRLADLNNDGKLDVVAAGRATHNLRIYFNEN
jgi:hypothetical protein